MTIRQCACCLLPFRGAATAAYVVGLKPGGLARHLVCPTCARRGVLVVSPPERRGERPAGLVDLGELPGRCPAPSVEIAGAHHGERCALGAGHRGPHVPDILDGRPAAVLPEIPSPWCRVCCDRLIGPWGLYVLARPLAYFARHDDPGVVNGSPGTHLMVCDQCAGPLLADGVLIQDGPRSSATVNPT